MDEGDSVILSVDPGSSGTGIAFWNEETWKELDYPLYTQTIQSGSKLWINQVNDIASHFSDVLLRGYDVVKVIIEFPEYMEGVRGEATAKQESLTKLAFFVGAVSQVAWSYNKDVELINVHKWKGQLSKEAVITRIIRRLPEIEQKLNPKTHQWDSIGVGLYAKGFF